MGEHLKKEYGELILKQRRLMGKIYRCEDLGQLITLEKQYESLHYFLDLKEGELEGLGINPSDCLPFPEYL